MKNISDRFIKWYRLTHWMYQDHWLEFDEYRNQFTLAETQAMYSAYRAGFNRANKEIKDAKTRTT
jgi:hypothetical protein